MNIQNTIKSLSVLAVLALSACGGGGSGGGDGNGGGGVGTPTPSVAPTPTSSPTVTATPSPDPSPTPVASCSDSADTDNDGLLNCEESSIGTNPNLADTDGDGFLDKEEVDNWDRNGGNHLRFNPLVADVPRLRIQQLSRPVIQLYATTEESGTVTRGMSEADFAETELTTTRGRSNTHRVEEQHTVNVNAEVQQRGPIKSGSVSASYEYQHTDTTTDTTYWNETQVETNRRESSEYFETINSQTVSTRGGEIKVLMGLLNDGDVSFTLNNMGITAFRVDPNDPGNLIPVGTLRHNGPLSFTPNPLGPNPDVGNADFTPFSFEYRAEDNPSEISRVLENSNQLVLRPVNLSLTGQRPDVDLNLAAQNVRSRTAEVIIDFGNFQNLPTERYRVAIDTGNGNTLDFDQLMADRLNYPYAFEDASFSANDMTFQGRGLTSLRGVEMNDATNSYWLVAHTFTPLNSPAGSLETVMYNVLTDAYNPSDIQLSRGDVLHLVYVTDTDLDGISDRLEQLNGTRIDSADSDGDGLDDALESYGWLTNLASAPCDEGSPESLVRVFANPLESDSDGDTISDSDEFSACSNPRGSLRASAGEDRVVNAGSTITLRADVENASSAGSLSYSWRQLAGDDVGQLPNSSSVRVPAPSEVTSLVFELSVTDRSQNDSTATSQVRVLVAEDASAAYFVDSDLGHDFNNDGRSPEAPFATLERAATMVTDGGDIYVNTPDDGEPITLTQTLQLPVNSSLYGGFDDGWRHSPDLEPTPILSAPPSALMSAGSSEPIWLSGLAVRVTDSSDNASPSAAIVVSQSATVTIEDVIAEGGNLSLPSHIARDGSRDFISSSSHGIILRDLDRLNLRDSLIMAGSGMPGAPGVLGSPGRTGAKGGNASGRERGGGGNGNGNGAAGGRGGHGANFVVTCASGSGGIKGGDSGTISGGGGGRAGVADADIISCSVSGGGSGGSVTRRAATGNSGSAARLSLDFSEGVFAGNHGSGGGKGAGGAGGGGGGGGAGINFSDGGGGSGGGEGGDGGAGGSGGRAAGGSFGLLIDGVEFAQIVNTRIESTSGGAGGRGGAGGTGGQGGAGGTRGTGVTNGGTGGQGGPGGHGGAGGGGTGGPSAGLVLLNGSVMQIANSSVVTAAAGNGSSPNAGVGGWNYGVFLDAGSSANDQENVIFTLGTSGNGAPEAAPSNR